MTSIDLYLTHAEHRDLVDEYRALDTSEDRLAWLMERPSLQAPIPDELVTDDRKVPGCLSGLWLHGSVTGGVCTFAARSESDMVQGIGSFICDLYSNRSAAEVLAMGDAMVNVLGLERLLSTTRRRAVTSTVAYILHTARSQVGIEAAA